MRAAGPGEAAAAEPGERGRERREARPAQPFVRLAAAARPGASRRLAEARARPSAAGTRSRAVPARRGPVSVLPLLRAAGGIRTQDSDSPNQVHLQARAVAALGLNLISSCPSPSCPLQQTQRVGRRDLAWDGGVRPGVAPSKDERDARLTRVHSALGGGAEKRRGLLAVTPSGACIAGCCGRVGSSVSLGSMELEAQWWRGQLAADIHQALRYKVTPRRTFPSPGCATCESRLPGEASLDCLLSRPEKASAAHFVKVN